MLISWHAEGGLAGCTHISGKLQEGLSCRIKHTIICQLNLLFFNLFWFTEVVFWKVSQWKKKRTLMCHDFPSNSPKSPLLPETWPRCTLETDHAVAPTAWFLSDILSSMSRWAFRLFRCKLGQSPLSLHSLKKKKKKIQSSSLFKSPKK